MKKYIIIIISIAIIALLMAGCKKDNETVSPGSIYGTITDKATCDCVSAAGVELMPKGLKTVTGSDGSFQFTQVEPGEYNLFITKTGYQDLKSNTITVKSGEQAKGDVQIEKLPTSLQIMDNDGQPVTELNFGGDAGIISKTFKIYNKGAESFHFEINKYVGWIESITPASGNVPVNGNCPVVVKINRDNLVDGLNTSSIIITSETVGGIELVIKASKNPALSTLNSNGSEITELNFGSDANSVQKTFKLRNNKTKKLNYTITKTANWISNINPSSGELNAGTSATISIFINRELLADGDNSTLVLINTPNDGGVELSVKAKKNPENGIVELTAANLMVQKLDIGCVNFSSAQTMCESSDLGGYTDWRLPSKEDLMVLYNNRALIGGFTDGRYWSSTYYDYQSYDSYYYGVDFFNGSVVHLNTTNEYYVRAVRYLIGITTPTVTTSAPLNITASTVSCGGNVTSDGGANVTERGICLSKNPNPNINSTIFKSGSGTGAFTINLINLNNNTTYYVKAYAKNSEGVAYGEEQSFTTELFPTFQYGGETYQVAPDPGNKMNWSNANSYSNNLTLHGLSGWEMPTKDELVQMYSERNSIGGFRDESYWSSSYAGENGSYEPMYYYVNFSTGHISSCSYDWCSYYVRPIRPINGGNPSTPPTVTTSTPSNISTNSATCGGNVTSDGGASVTARGVCWSSSQNPTISNSHTTNGTGTGSFTSNITGLTENTTYYVRAYATNSVGTSYGTQKSFTTTSGGGGGGSATPPTVTTVTPFDIAINSAACGGNVTSDGGATVFERGICYSTSQNPTTSNYTVQSGSGTGSYNCYMTGLNQNTTYYVRAYAINSEGTAYGYQESFTTNSEPINGWLYYDDGNGIDALGFNNGGTIYWANMFPSSMLTQYAGTNIVEIEALLNLAGTYTLQIYTGGTSAPGSLVATINVNHNYSDFGWYNIPLPNAVPLNTSQNLWVVLSKTHTAGEHPAGACADSGNPNGRWISDGSGTWEDLAQSLPYTWGIHTYVSNQTKSGKHGKRQIISAQIKGTNIPKP
ncbi:MAG: DUF1566 domain-containing protein [Bacteroidales bacterium]|nr:DUF1566 domain-containing protein [Bacteroidales bacterium]